MLSRLVRFATVTLALCAVTLPAWAAPLFPDVPEAHWARDAVATLAAKGLVEGYPDGTFKGDRAASRWEAAMIVARLLARMEQEHATFASKAEVEEVRRLAAALREELDALGVRVTNLEESAGRLDQRVSELERITFYGSVEARMVAQTFRNRGASDNDNGRRGGGLPGGLPYLDYEAGVGTGALAMIRPQVGGILPEVDYVRGRALTNGTGYSTRVNLGMRLRVSPELDAGAEFAAYTSQGDRAVDAYWGVHPPYLSNPAVNAVGGPQPLHNQPYTKMVLDSFWVRHNPSKTRLLLGSVDKLLMDPLIYAGQPNLGVYGPARIPGFGFQVTGETGLAEGSLLRWEALGTRFGTGNNFLGQDYQHHVMGSDLAWEFDRGAGAVKLNFARVVEEAPTGGPLPVGLTSLINVHYGASTGWYAIQWVNPPGHFAAQRSAFEQANTGGVLNSVDTRPIPGWNGAADNAIGLPATVGGNFGPEGQNTYGLNARYEWTLDDDTNIRLKAEYARSDYQSNRNSSYVAHGDAARVELGSRLLGGDFDVLGWYLSVDPTYNPALFAGNVFGFRFPRLWNFAGRFHMHDNVSYPHNREGFGLGTKWKFDGGRGELVARGSWLAQKQTSLYDVRALPGSAGVGAPNFPVLGFAPGFIDPQFQGYAHPLQWGRNSGSSFTDTLQPMEDPRGHVGDYFLGVTYKWDEPRVRVEASYGHTDWVRRSSLAANFGGSQNHVDLDSDWLHLGVNWDLDDRWTVLGGVDRVSVGGHDDPAGLFNAYAVATGGTAFVNLDSVQTVPFVGFQNRLSKDTSWDVTVSRYDTVDRVPTSVFAGRALDTIGATAHPFSWDGWQVQTHFQLKF